MLKSYKYYLENLDCANCAKKIEDALKEDKRFTNVVVNFSTLTLSFKTDLDNPFKEIFKIIKRVEPDVLIYKEKKEEKKSDLEIFRFILALIVLAISFLISNELIKEIMLIISYVLLMYKTFMKAIKKIIKSHNVDENALICISAIGAYILGEHMEGLMVLLLYVLGKILEDKAVNKSRSSIKDLVELKLRYASHVFDKMFLKVKKKYRYNGKKIILVMINAFSDSKKEATSTYKPINEYERKLTEYLEVKEYNLANIRENWYNKFTISKCEKYLLYLLMSREHIEEIAEFVKGD